jgi:hypothetical protein
MRLTTIPFFIALMSLGAIAQPPQTLRDNLSAKIKQIYNIEPGQIAWQQTDLRGNDRSLWTTVNCVMAADQSDVIIAALVKIIGPELLAGIKRIKVQAFGSILDLIDDEAGTIEIDGNTAYFDLTPQAQERLNKLRETNRAYGFKLAVRRMAGFWENARLKEAFPRESRFMTNYTAVRNGDELVLTINDPSKHNFVLVGFENDDGKSLSLFWIDTWYNDQGMAAWSTATYIPNPR